MAGMKPHRLYIDGSWKDSDGDSVLAVLNPATEEVVGAVPEGTVTDIERAVAAARRAFDEGHWPTLTHRERAAAMLRFADALQARKQDLVELNVLEVGSIRSWAEFLQVGLPIEHFRDMAERVLMQFPFEKPMPPTFGLTLAQGVVRREPRGVAALISAYNAPTFLNLMKLAPALAAGCTVVLRTAASASSGASTAWRSSSSPRASSGAPADEARTRSYNLLCYLEKSGAATGDARGR
jgi:acyl-CoA reductase-like NAD-dependent aldehyde dehydrogenase